MPSVEENRRVWDSTYHWNRSGEEWSSAWGSADMQWHATILPRIHTYLPAGTVLELGPGFGRWTHYLKDRCDRLILVDLSEKCIRACRERFPAANHLEYHVNDGLSLDMVEDESVDFVFSFDSLVHAEENVIETYLAQLSRKLTRTAVGFIHHSNIGEYRTYYSIVQGIPLVGRALVKLKLADWDHWRARSMTAGKFRLHAERAGLLCIGQETINWGTRRLIDCLSVFTRKDSPWARPVARLKNPHFMREARHVSKLGRLYRADGSRGPAC